MVWYEPVWGCTWGASMHRFLVWRVCATLVVALLVAAAGAVAAAAASASESSPTPAATQSAVAPSAVPTPLSAAAADIPFTFRAYPFKLREIPIEGRPLSTDWITPREDTGLHDADGVRMQIIDGKTYEWARGQANYGLENLNSYRLTGDQFFLDRCIAQADRIVSYHVEADDDAWYFPAYPSRSRHGKPGEWIQAPYYSALAEGRILLLFSRLALLTGSQEWRDAADHTFAAFLRPGPRADGPYVVDVDAGGYYWLQEWPWPHMTPDCTLNGHNSSSFGVYEYYMLTHDARAAALFRAAATTIKHYIPQFRRDGWISCYCLLHRTANPNYHEMHVGQLLTLYEMTGDVAFAKAADTFRADYPRPAVHGKVHVAAGVWPLVRVDERGRVVAQRTLVVRRDVAWRTVSRQRLWRRSPVFLRISSGPGTGWWLAEQRGRVYYQGAVEQLGYTPVRTLVLAAHRALAGLQFDTGGTITRRKPFSTGDGLRLKADASAVIDGLRRVRVSEGELAGYWLPLGPDVRLR
jgi:hypothetical protein